MSETVSGAEIVMRAEAAMLGAADYAVSDGTRDRVERAVHAATRRAYTGDLTRFRTWCAEHARSSLPATAETVAEYASHLADEGKAPTTIRRALAAAIRTEHRNAGLVKPDTAAAGYVLRSHRRDRAAAGIRDRQAAPITIDVLRALVDATQPGLPGLRDRALVVLGFALGARRSELVALDLSNLREAPEGLVVLIRHSKTDQDAAGDEVAVPYGTHPETCPVRTVRAWRDALAAAGATSGPVFRRIDRHGTLGRAADGRGGEDGRLTGQAVGIVLSRLAERPVPERYRL